MFLLPRPCVVLALTGFLFGCQLSTPTPQGVTPNAVAGDAIEVTALETPAAAPVAVAAEGMATAPAQGSAPSAPEADTPVPAPVPVADGAEEPSSAETEADAAEVAPAPPPKTPLQIACEKKRGTWADTGGGLMTCIVQTRDSGKRCTRESDCEGVCLARSGTCAPAKPLLGCNEILQDNGTRATECIE